MACVIPPAPNAGGARGIRRRQSPAQCLLSRELDVQPQLFLEICVAARPPY
jgi:hypothetical protein